MPKANEPITEEERSRRFKAEVRKRIKDGDFDQKAADDAIDRMVRKSIKDHGA